MGVAAIIVAEFFVGSAMQNGLAGKTVFNSSDHGMQDLKGQTLITKIGTEEISVKRINTLYNSFFRCTQDWC